MNKPRVIVVDVSDRAHAVEVATQVGACVVLRVWTS